MRVNTVKAARKAQGICGACGEAIEVGQSYRWIEFRFGPKVSRHATCRNFRPSEMTSSDKLSRIYGAVENVEDLLEGDWSADDLNCALTEAAEEIRAVAEEYREAAEAIESGTGNRMPMCDELEEKADEVEAFADALESAADIDDFEDEPEPEEDEDDDTFAERREAWENEVEEARDNARDAAESALGEIPV